MSQVSKQIIYGIFYLAILAALGFSGYFLFLKAPASCIDQVQNQNETGVDCGGLPGQGGCVSCEIKQLTPIVLGKVLLLRGGDIVTVVAPMENLNPIYGAQQFHYTLQLLDDAGQTIKTINKNSFLHASEKTRLIETGISDARQQITQAKIVIEDIDWQSTQEWWPPDLTVKEIQTDIGAPEVIVRGIIVNTNNFIIAQVVLRATVADSFGAIVGASRTTLESLQPFEERTFQISLVPDSALLGSIVPEATELFVTARK